MQSIRRQFHRLFTRFARWILAPWSPRRTFPSAALTFTAPIHREVTPNGIRVFSLCGCCGARLTASATLCEECAQKSRSARP